MSPQDLTLTSTRGEEHLTVSGNWREDKSSRIAAGSQQWEEGAVGRARVFLSVSRVVFCFGFVFRVW